MPVHEQIAKVAKARYLSEWFKLEITLSMFGKVIVHWVFPPKSNNVEPENDD